MMDFSFSPTSGRGTLTPSQSIKARARLAREKSAILLRILAEGAPIGLY
jgi:hypothetical protein